MRVWLIILFFGVSITGFSGFRYTLKQFSFFYGKTFYNQGPNFNTFEFQYDYKSTDCGGARPYFGAGLIYGFNQNQEIIGLKGMFTPPRIRMPISRKWQFHPYLFAQGNLVRTNKEAVENQHHIIPGIGLNFMGRISQNLLLRPQFQLGYNWNENFVPRSNGWVIEAKIGVGINSRVFKRKKTQTKK